jgi:UDP-glucose 4-epimerase
MKTIFITGAAGLIGSRLAEWILANQPGYRVVAIDDLSGGYRSNVPDGAAFVKLDLAAEDVDELFARYRPAIVYHCAAYAAEGLSPFMRRYNYRTNLMPAARLITASIKHGVERFVFTSSMAVYGRGNPPFDEGDRRQPIDPYGIAKYSIEQDLAIAKEMHGLDYCIIRPHNIYGRNQNIWDRYRNVLGIWMYRLLHGMPITIYGTGEQQRAFSYVDDILPPLWRAATIPEASAQIINLGGPQQVAINEAADTMLRIAGGGEKLYRPGRHEVKDAWCTTAKSERLLGYEFRVDLAEGLARMWDWAKKQPDRPQRTWEIYELAKPEWLP